jgi:hypothetical protein
MVKYKTITNDWNYDTSCTLYHFRFGTLKISSAWFLLYRVYKRAAEETGVSLLTVEKIKTRGKKH